MVIIDGIKDTVQEKEMSDTSVPQLLQHCDAETQIQNLENSSLKFNNCDLLTENPDISKHLDTPPWNWNWVLDWV